MAIAEFLSGSVDLLTRNRFLREPTKRLVNSKLTYQLIEWQVSRYIGLLQEPTNEGILRGVQSLDKFASFVIPDSQDRVLESGVTGRVKREFADTVITGKDTNFTRTIKQTIGLMGERYLRTVLLNFGAINFGLGKLNQRLKPDEYHIEALALQPNSECNAKPRCLGCFAGRNQGKLDDETLDRILRQSIELTSRYTIIAGGEPLLEKIVC